MHRALRQILFLWLHVLGGMCQRPQAATTVNGLNGCFQDEPVLARSPWFSSFTCYRREPFEMSGTGFLDVPMPFSFYPSSSVKVKNCNSKH